MSFLSRHTIVSEADIANKPSQAIAEFETWRHYVHGNYINQILYTRRSVKRTCHLDKETSCLHECYHQQENLFLHVPQFLLCVVIHATRFERCRECMLMYIDLPET